MWMTFDLDLDLDLWPWPWPWPWPLTLTLTLTLALDLTSKFSLVVDFHTKLERLWHLFFVARRAKPWLWSKSSCKLAKVSIFRQNAKKAKLSSLIFLAFMLIFPKFGWFFFDKMQMTFDFWPWFWVIGLGAWTLRHFLEVDLCEMGICWSLSQNLVLRLNLRYSEIRRQGRTKFFRGLFLWNGYKLMFESKLGLGLVVWDKSKSARKGVRNLLEVDLCEMVICWSLSPNWVLGFKFEINSNPPVRAADIF